MIYRLELHETETGKWFAQVHDGDTTDEPPLWESDYYDELDDAFSFGKYEINRRKDLDAEERRAKRYQEQDLPDHASDAGISSAGR